ncbi:RTA1 like protein-domain-containing protein [Plectosphaerella plurivora]|uniref:RTA1 like protein-domain-containing protein n=1 Tax=Plectosphaerella plurivora TaxID=936078 RepID=A0A9P8V949_9PEZI|nr:RTA1 like protein-domain-containing protein [Plectosphaerella plurivora]
MPTTEQKDQYYKYYPSTILAAITAALFGLLSVLHLFQLVRKRTWYFIPFFCGCLLEMIGYGARSINASKTPDWTLVLYIIETLFILLAPALLAASIYMILGRVILRLDAGHLSWVRPKWLTKLFVTGDVISFVTQLAGGGILASAKDKKGNDMGKLVIIIGLGIQLIFFGFFFVVTIAFHERIRRQPTQRSHDSSIPWRSTIFVLYAVSTLIMVRSIFRVIEYAMGKDGILMSNEVYIYVFDAVLIFICAAAFVIWHPSRAVSADRQRKISGEIELEEATTQTVFERRK